MAVALHFLELFIHHHYIPLVLIVVYLFVLFAPLNRCLLLVPAFIVFEGTRTKERVFSPPVPGQSG